MYANNHLKLLEKFCLDDNQFICWMCHNFNYADEHRGHRVVSLAEAYKIIKVGVQGLQSAYVDIETICPKSQST